MLFSIAGAPLVSVLAAAPGKVTVGALEVFTVHVNRRGNWILVRLQTSAGVSGVGEASHGRRDERTLALLRQFHEALKGRGIHDIEFLRRLAQPAIASDGLSAAVALSAIEQCLWDIAGKLHNVPCYEFFGGRIRDRIRNYANINRSTVERTPAGFATMAERAIRDGFNAVKLAPFDEMPIGLTDEKAIEEYTTKGLACAAAVRNAIGDANGLLIDVHSRFDRKHGLDLAKRMEPLNLFWLEEAVTTIEDLAAVNREAKMPTAGGESRYGVRQFYPYIKGEAVDIIMPDVKYCGGMLELKKIAAMAEGAGIPVAPHGPASPLGNVSAAHVCATLPNFHILEYSYGEVPWRAELIEPPERIDKGDIVLSSRPGLGITLNDATADKYRTV